MGQLFVTRLGDVELALTISSLIKTIDILGLFIY